MSWPEPLKSWLRGRLRFRLFLALAIAVASFALLLRVLAGFYGPLLWLDVPFLIVLAFVILTQLRLVDDLADRDYDRVRHPQRVLALEASLKHIYAALAVLTFASLGLTAGLVSGRAAGALLLLEVCLLAIYTLSRRSRWPRLLHVHAVLLKYPGIVYCLAGAPALGAAGGSLLAGTFLMAAAGELGHDAELRRLPGGRAVLLAVLLLLAAFCVFFILRLMEATP
jgi:hypothetical protein